MAASVSLRHIGPAVSWLWAMGMMPARLTRPGVGFNPTCELAPEGQTIEPSVSVPTPPVAKFDEIAAAAAGLWPPGARSVAYGFWHRPPRPPQTDPTAVPRQRPHCQRLGV